MENPKNPIGYCLFSHLPKDWQQYFKQGQADKLGELILSDSGHFNSIRGVISLIYGLFNPLIGVWIIFMLSQASIAEIWGWLVAGISGDKLGQTLILSFMGLLFISLGFYYFMLFIFSFIEASLHKLGIYRFGILLTSQALLIRYPGDDWQGQSVVYLPHTHIDDVIYKPSRLKSEYPGKIVLNYKDHNGVRRVIEIDNGEYSLSAKPLLDKINTWLKNPNNSHYSPSPISENKLKQIWLSKVASGSAYMIYAFILMIVFNFTPQFTPH
jgi:hypothetical protein